MGGTGISSLRSCRTYRVIARARCVNTAEGDSSGLVTTLLCWRRRATTAWVIDTSCGRGRTWDFLMRIRLRSAADPHSARSCRRRLVLPRPWVRSRSGPFDQFADTAAERPLDDL